MQNRGKLEGMPYFWGWSLVGCSRGRDVRKYLLESSICDPGINRRNSSGTGARRECLLLPSRIHTHGPWQNSAAAKRLLGGSRARRRKVERKQACKPRPRCRAGGEAGRQKKDAESTSRLRQVCPALRRESEGGG